MFLMWVGSEFQAAGLATANEPSAKCVLDRRTVKSPRTYDNMTSVRFLLNLTITIHTYSSFGLVPDTTSVCWEALIHLGLDMHSGCSTSLPCPFIGVFGIDL